MSDWAMSHGAVPRVLGALPHRVCWGVYEYIIPPRGRRHPTTAGGNTPQAISSDRGTKPRPPRRATSWGSGPAYCGSGPQGVSAAGGFDAPSWWYEPGTSRPNDHTPPKNGEYQPRETRSGTNISGPVPPPWCPMGAIASVVAPETTAVPRRASNA